jgi:hypothetical protein
MLDGGDRPRPAEAPDLLQDRLAADAVLVGGRELDLGVGEGGGDGLDDRADLF